MQLVMPFDEADMALDAALDRVRERFGKRAVTRAVLLGLSSRRWSVEFEELDARVSTWLEVRGYPFGGGLAVHFRDVTARHKSEEQLRLLESSIARLNDIVIITEAGPFSESEVTIMRRISFSSFGAMIVMPGIERIHE